MGKRMEKVKTGSDKTVEYAGKVATVVTAIASAAKIVKEVIDATAKSKK